MKKREETYKTKKPESFHTTFGEGGIMKKCILFLIVLCFTIHYGHCLSIAAGPDYPTKPITMMVGYAAGGGTDLGARMIAKFAKEDVGQEIIIANKPGAGGVVAMTLLSKADPDGYTLCAATDTSVVFSPHTTPVGYKPLEDFIFISQYGVLHTGLAVLAESPLRSFKDLHEFAKKNPDKLTIGTVGKGGGSQVILEALAKIDGLKIKIVPFRGASPAMTALLGGHVLAVSCAGSGYAPHVKSGKVRLLAVFSEERMEQHPKVPTLNELGYSTLVFESWYLISAPKNTDKAIVKKLEESFRKAMDTPDFIKFAKHIEVYKKKTLSGDELKNALIRKNTNNESLLKQLGMVK